MSISWDLVDERPPSPEEWLATTHEPWERMPTETDLQWERFLAFREMGSARNLVSLSKQLGITSNGLYPIAAKYHWQHRAARWDYFLDELYRREVIAETREMARRHAKASNEALQALTLPIKVILAKAPEELAEALDAQDIMKLYRLVGDTVKAMPSIMAAERLALGAPTEIRRSEEENALHIAYEDEERLADVLRAVIGTNILDDLRGARDADEIVDAEVVELHPSSSTSETNSLPARTAD